MQRLRRLLRLAWIGLGLGFLAWMYWGFRLADWPAATLVSNSQVLVVESGDKWDFRPRTDAGGASLLFLPGGMVDPLAYAPLLRRVAEAGHRAVLLSLPLRCACLGGQEEDLFAAIGGFTSNGPWVLAGHSRGAMLATRYLAKRPAPLKGLLLAGTTHPRDFDLSQLSLPVTKLYGTRDGIAPYETSRSHAQLLPAHTRWVGIEGGNHVQFGYYRHQLFDDEASIPRQAQQDAFLRALLDLLAP